MTKEIVVNKVFSTEGYEFCPDCKSPCFGHRLKLIKSGRLESWYPKYIPQIKEICENCGKFIKFAKQEEWLIDKINNQIKEVKL